MKEKMRRLLLNLLVLCIEKSQLNSCQIATGWKLLWNRPFYLSGSWDEQLDPVTNSETTNNEIYDFFMMKFVALVLILVKIVFWQIEVQESI